MFTLGHVAKSLNTPVLTSNQRYDCNVGFGRKIIVCTLNCLLQNLWIIYNNWVMISGKRHCCSIFEMHAFGIIITTERMPFTSIIFKRSQKCQRPLSTKLSNSHHNSLDRQMALQHIKQMFFYGGGLTIK